MNQRINIDGFIREFSDKGYTLKDAKIILEDFKQTIVDILSRGDTLRLCGFLEFDLVWREAHNVRRPSDGAIVETPAKYLLRVYPGNYLTKHLGVAAANRGAGDASE